MENGKLGWETGKGKRKTHCEKRSFGVLSRRVGSLTHRRKASLNFLQSNKINHSPIHLFTFSPLFKPKPAFTLAEALFLLYLSAIVAMLAIPLIKIANKKNDLPKKWQTEYYKILDAQASAAQDNNKNNQNEPPGMFDGLFISDDLIKSIESHLEVEKDCGDSSDICGTDPPVALGKGEDNVYHTLSGGHLDEKDLYKNQVLLKDGANIYCSENKILASSLWVDVNGYANGPNKLGVDLFGLIVTGKGIIPMGMKNSSANPTQPGDCSVRDKYIPVTYSHEASDYTGATCSYVRLFKGLNQD